MTDLVICERQELVGVADAIRTASGSQDVFTLNEMATAIGVLSSSGDNADELKSISDAINLKNNGTDDSYSLGDISNAILNLGYAGIPQHHYVEAGRVAQNIRKWKDEHSNSLVFGAISDNHVFANNATYSKNTEASIRHAAFALETVGCMTECDFIVNLGDNCWENGIDTDNAFEGSEYLRDAIQSAFVKLPSYRLIGNHDRSSNTALSYSLSGAYNEFDDYGTTQIRGFGYKDYADKKIRVICLNTTDYLNASGGHALSYDQKDFLMRSLDLSDKSDVAEWQILLLSHIPLDFSGGDYNTEADVKSILSAYVNGTAVDIDVVSSYCLNETPSQYSTFSSKLGKSENSIGMLSYSYVGKNDAKIMANIHGHVHNNSNGKLTDVDIVRISTPNTCFYETYKSKYGYSVSDAEFAKLTKTAGTVRDTSVTFYCIDIDSQVIYTFGYGAGGSDLVLTYADAGVYSVTYALTLCTSSNTDKVVVDGESFRTTITANTDATISSVKVTMDGVDITFSAYNNGVVNIANVTGNIVITAIATEPAFEYVVPDLDGATRMNWSSSVGFSIENANGHLALGVSTANDHGFADRESGTIYLMPIPAKANTAIVETTDAGFTEARFMIVSDAGGSLARVNDSGWFAKNADNRWTFEFDRSSGGWIAINLSYSHDGSIKTAWGYDAKSNVTVTFTNGVSGGSSGGGDDSGVTDDPDIIIENLFSTSDANYSVGRLNSSGAVNTSYTNGFVSGYIPAVKGDVIRAKSANTAFLNSYGVLAFYKSDKTYINQIYINDGAGRLTMSSDNLEFSCDTGTLASSFNDMAYVRIMGYGNPDGFVITKNEEIS